MATSIIHVRSLDVFVHYVAKTIYINYALRLPTTYLQYIGSDINSSRMGLFTVIRRGFRKWYLGHQPQLYFPSFCTACIVYKTAVYYTKCTKVLNYCPMKEIPFFLSVVQVLTLLTVREVFKLWMVERIIIGKWNPSVHLWVWDEHWLWGDSKPFHPKDFY